MCTVQSIKDAIREDCSSQRDMESAEIDHILQTLPLLPGAGTVFQAETAEAGVLVLHKKICKKLTATILFTGLWLFSCPEMRGVKSMAVFRIERTRDYTVMSNHHLRNEKLSLKAKGLLSMMLSCRMTGTIPPAALRKSARRAWTPSAGAAGVGDRRVYRAPPAARPAGPYQRHRVCHL